MNSVKGAFWAATGMMAAVGLATGAWAQEAKPAAGGAPAGAEVKAKEAVSRVDLANALSKSLKIKGRIALGVIDTGDDGSYPDASLEVPDAKLQLEVAPDAVNTAVIRFNLNNANTGNANDPLIEYLFLQSKDFIPALKDTPLKLSSRLGRYKLGFGEETWVDNAIENPLPTTSAAKAGVNDEAAELESKYVINKDQGTSLGAVASISDGATGVGKDNNSDKAFMGKLYATPIAPLFLSGTFYDSGDLGTGKSEMSIAGLNSVSTNATEWGRQAWEADVRVDLWKGKKAFNPIAYNDSKVILRGAYGEFADDVTGADDRDGAFSFTDVMVNVCPKFYVAARYSVVELDDDATAKLNSVTANQYERYSVGAGYRWSDNTIIKLGYDWNDESGEGVSDKDNDQLTVLVTALF